MQLPDGRSDPVETESGLYREELLLRVRPKHLPKGAAEELPVAACTSLDLGQMLPFREFAVYKGQRNMPGFYWFETVGEHVPYESRLEMRVLQRLDFGAGAEAVVAQPFELTYGAAGRTATHVPDFLLSRRGASRLLVDVKPARYAKEPKHARSFAATREACLRLGWDYEVWTEPEPVVAANVDWLGAFRRRPPRLMEFAASLIEGAAGEVATVDGLLNRFGKARCLAA